METIKFNISKWYVIANYFSIVGCPIFAAFFLLGPFFLWHDSSLIELSIFLFFGVFFIVGGICSISILPQMKDSVYISENQIMREYSADGTFTIIQWKENFTIRNRLFLGRLELISQDGQRIVKIEHQTERYQEIYEFINIKLMEKTGHLS